MRPDLFNTAEEELEVIRLFATDTTAATNFISIGDGAEAMTVSILCQV